MLPRRHALYCISCFWWLPAPFDEGYVVRPSLRQSSNFYSEHLLLLTQPNNNSQDLVMSVIITDLVQCIEQLLKMCKSVAEFAPHGVHLLLLRQPYRCNRWDRWTALRLCSTLINFILFGQAKGEKFQLNLNGTSTVLDSDHTWTSSNRNLKALPHPTLIS